MHRSADDARCRGSVAAAHRLGNCCSVLAIPRGPPAFGHLVVRSGHVQSILLRHGLARRGQGLEVEAGRLAVQALQQQEAVELYRSVLTPETSPFSEETLRALGPIDTAWASATHKRMVELEHRLQGKLRQVRRTVGLGNGMTSHTSWGATLAWARWGKQATARSPPLATRTQDQTNMIKESIRMGHNAVGDYYYAQMTQQALQVGTGACACCCCPGGVARDPALPTHPDLCACRRRSRAIRVRGTTAAAIAT